MAPTRIGNRCVIFDFVATQRRNFKLTEQEFSSELSAYEKRASKFFKATVVWIQQLKKLRFTAVVGNFSSFVAF